MMAAQLYSQSMTVIISPSIAADENITITPAVTAVVVLMYLFSFIRSCVSYKLDLCKHVNINFKLLQVYLWMDS